MPPINARGDDDADDSGVLCGRGCGSGGSGGLEEGEVDMGAGETGKKSAQLSYNQRTVQKWEEDEKLGKTASVK